MATPEMYAFGIAYGDQLLQYAEDYLDQQTGRATKEPWKRYSFAIDAVLGIAGLATGVFGDRLGIRMRGYTPLIMSILAGNHLGKITKDIIEWYSPKATAARPITITVAPKAPAPAVTPAPKAAGVTFK